MVARPLVIAQVVIAQVVIAHVVATQGNFGRVKIKRVGTVV